MTAYLDLKGNPPKKILMPLEIKGISLSVLFTKPTKLEAILLTDFRCGIW